MKTKLLVLPVLLSTLLLVGCDGVSSKPTTDKKDGNDTTSTKVVTKATTTKTTTTKSGTKSKKGKEPTTTYTRDGNPEDTQTGNVQNFDVRKARMVQEYALTLNLVSKKITAQTADSGDWSDPHTWKSGMVPQEGARILIHANHKVVINKEIDTPYRTIKVEGELAFNPHKNTKLVVDTILTTSGSILRIGEPSLPIDKDKHAQIVIRDYNGEGMITNDPKSPDYDPLRIGQGILTNGLFLVHGATKTPYITIKGKGVKKGMNVISLDDEPYGWQIGDRVVVLGTSKDGTESESAHITDIDYTNYTITIDKTLKYYHYIAKTTIKNAGMKVHVANLSRNVIIKTDPDSLAGMGDKNEYSNVEHRGHVLFMHNNNVNVNYAQFQDLGRTNKKFHLDETTFDSESADAKAIHIGTNQAARYAVHFHRAGLNSKIGRVIGCSVVESPGWGYVNHSSNVIMKENVAYHVYGASFITEAGDEHGSFEANMAIETRGVGNSNIKGWQQRIQYNDWGFQGNGFWILGPNVDFVDNIVNGSSNTAYAFNHKTIDSVTGVIITDKNTNQTNDHDYITVPLKSFVGNIAYGNSGGVFAIGSGTRGGGLEKIKGLLAWNNAPLTSNAIIDWWYPDNVSMEDITIIGDINNPQYLGIASQTKLRKTTLKNIKIEGLHTGILIPQYYGPNLIKDAYLNNVINMQYNAATTNKGTDTRIEGKITYGDLPGDIKQTKIKFALTVRDVSWKNYWNRQFNTFNVVYAPDGQTPMQLYLAKEQKPDFVIEVGDQKGKSNAKLISEGHKPVGGMLLPNGAKVLKDMDDVAGVAITN